ncbi:MAG: hypothetical protein A3J55_02420 [Candidatus Ryanbacteria bacterium RIFCSPHIGHO2_02_FULL_45_17b]|uniref:Nudix hydrolase domain-containing protein n=1 Tax=Candidatus Ryanbacteria bacterium RIFCSPHIGHO2_01_FULL_45_22 TaxID=1802114 RepID=A0A1G2G060_9BACT|nr:MAG: hypothetical protein A2719_00860 [Candidatus Ryanbacteria bacterium RIFCSPHIGHO2_01_FULL_45_22]OGZ46785.1 MAG: hypothetical protein A3J55_02420 [Candidatus Ryanbacteria bacterium RIFCSPHIGHO2_02_FULL_45_17b]
MSHMRIEELVSWEKVGDEETLAEDLYGKRLYKQGYRRPGDSHTETFTHFSQRDWSVVLAITENKEVLVVWQYKQGCHKIVQELPAGTANFTDEKPETVAKRELGEETSGYTGQFIFLGPPQFIATRNSPTRFFSFLALDCKKIKDGKLDKIEDIAVEKVPLEKWIRRCLTEVEEPSAIITTFRALPHLKKKYDLDLDAIFST